jgi:hypothetical protein
MPEVTTNEAPVLALSQVAVCLHLLEMPRAKSEPPPYPDCPVMSSMELDLLSRQFQQDPPLGSCTETHRRVPVEIVFPAVAHYRSEGRTVELACAAPEREADVVVSSTLVRTSGIRIWHVAIAPRECGSFSELDIIKLIHLYAGRSERSNLAETTRFRLVERGHDRSGLHTLPGALRAIVKEDIGEVELRGGTVQIVVGDTKAGATVHADLLETAFLAGDADNKAARDKLTGWLDAAGPEASCLSAYCGIATGLLDYANLDASEVIDSLEPTIPGVAVLTRFHGATLTYIADEDRAMIQCRDSVGVSPYLIIPHAAIIHNEALIESADRLLDSCLTNESAELPQLEAAAADGQRLLHRNLLPNIFNYRSERELFEKGARTRGATDRKESAAAKLQELNGVIAAQWSDRRDRGQMVIAILLAVMSLLQLKDFIFTALEPGAGATIHWLTMAALVVLLVIGMTQLWRMGTRRSKPEPK